MSEQAFNVKNAQVGALNDAERVVLKTKEGADLSLVVLGVLDVDGKDYALVAREDGIGQDEVYAFAYGTDGDGNAALSVIEDDEIYEEVLHLFGDLFVTDEEDAA